MRGLPCPRIAPLASRPNSLPSALASFAATVSKPNSCALYRLHVPTRKAARFSIEEVQRFEDAEYGPHPSAHAPRVLPRPAAAHPRVRARRGVVGRYHSNSWLVKLACNGRVLAAPTVNGRVVLFSLETGKPIGSLRDHEGLPIAHARARAFAADPDRGAAKRTIPAAADREVRDVLFHPTKQVVLTCGDGAFEEGV